MTVEGQVFVDYLYEMVVYQYTKSVAIMMILWCCYLYTKIECIVDFGWVLCHYVIGLSLVIQYYDRQNYRGWIMLGCLTLWFVCLGGMLFIRVISGHKDKRYEALAEGSTKRGLFFLFQYQFQAILIFFTSTPLYYTFREYTEKDGEVRWTFIVGAVLCVFGILMEATADYQLRRYIRVKGVLKKQREAQIGQEKEADENKVLISQEDYEDSRFPGVYKRGLWSRSRHPNLFYETVIWIGFAVAGLTDFTISFFGFIGPICLFCIMYFVTIPLTERTMEKTRPYWQEFIKETNKYLPFF